MAVVPSLKEFKDILLSFENHRFYGTGENLLQNRLGVKPKISDVSKKLIFNSQENFKQFKKFLSVYKTSILKNAEYEKKNYTKYLNSIIKYKEKVILCDQGFNGTVQSSIEKILESKLYGVYLSVKKT